MTAFAAAAVDCTILQYNQEVTCLSIEVIIFLFSHLQLLSLKRLLLHAFNIFHSFVHVDSTHLFFATVWNPAIDISGGWIIGVYVGGTRNKSATYEVFQH